MRSAEWMARISEIQCNATTLPAIYMKIEREWHLLHIVIGILWDSIPQNASTIVQSSPILLPSAQVSPLQSYPHHLLD